MAGSIVFGRDIGPKCPRKVWWRKGRGTVFVVSERGERVEGERRLRCMEFGAGVGFCRDEAWVRPWRLR